VYRLHQDELEAIADDTARLYRLIELNAINSAKNICHSTIVQNAWKRGQSLTVHAWAYNLENGRVNKLDFSVDNNMTTEDIYNTEA
jgi:carbonic anhydrase